MILKHKTAPVSKKHKKRAPLRKGTIQYENKKLQNFVQKLILQLNKAISIIDESIHHLRWHNSLMHHLTRINSNLIKYKLHFQHIGYVLQNQPKNQKYYQRFRVLPKELLDQLTPQRIYWRYVKFLNNFFERKILEQCVALQWRLGFEAKRRYMNFKKDGILVEDEGSEKSYEFVELSCLENGRIKDKEEMVKLMFDIEMLVTHSSCSLLTIKPFLFFNFQQSVEFITQINKRKSATTCIFSSLLLSNPIYLRAIRRFV